MLKKLFHLTGNGVSAASDPTASRAGRQLWNRGASKFIVAGLFLLAGAILPSSVHAWTDLTDEVSVSTLGSIDFSGSSAPWGVNQTLYMALGSSTNAITDPDTLITFGDVGSFGGSFTGVQRCDSAGYCNPYPQFNYGNAAFINGVSLVPGWYAFLASFDYMGTPDEFFWQAYYDGSQWIDASSDFSARWVETYPSFATTTLSTSVLLGADFYNDYGTTLRITLDNIDTSFTYVPIDLPVLSSGYNSVGTTTNLQAGAYFATYSVLGSSLPPRTGSFIVVSSLYPTYQSLVPVIASSTPVCADSASSTAWWSKLINFGCALIVPSPEIFARYTTLDDSLSTKLPFAYVYDAYDIFASLSSSTASSTLPLVSYTQDFGTGSTTITLVDPAGFFEFVPEAVQDSLRFLSQAAMTISLVYYFWNRGRGLLRDKTNAS